MSRVCVVVHYAFIDDEPCMCCCTLCIYRRRAVYVLLYTMHL